MSKAGKTSVSQTLVRCIKRQLSLNSRIIDDTIFSFTKHEAALSMRDVTATRTDATSSIQLGRHRPAHDSRLVTPASAQSGRAQPSVGLERADAVGGGRRRRRGTADVRRRRRCSRQVRDEEIHVSFVSSYLSSASGCSATSKLDVVSFIGERLRSLRESFSLRTSNFKERAIQPPTPSSDGLSSGKTQQVIYCGDLVTLF